MEYNERIRQLERVKKFKRLQKGDRIRMRWGSQLIWGNVLENDPTLQRLIINPDFTHIYSEEDFYIKGEYCYSSEFFDLILHSA